MSMPARRTVDRTEGRPKLCRSKGRKTQMISAPRSWLMTGQACAGNPDYNAALPISAGSDGPINGSVRMGHRLDYGESSSLTLIT